MAQAPPTTGLLQLSTVLKRLDAVTSRLEDVAMSQSFGSLRSATGAAHDSLVGTVPAGAVGMSPSPSRGGAAPTPPAPPPPPPPQEEVTPPVKAYVDEVGEATKEFEALGKKVGGIVGQASALVPPLVDAQYAYLKMASGHCKPPTAAEGQGLLKPQADAIGAIMAAKDKLGRTKEGRDWGSALSVLSEGAAAFGWVQVEPAPAPFVGEMKNSAQFWIDRVNKQCKETDPDAVAWARSFGAIIEALQKYVKKWHTTGVVWNPNGPGAPATVPSASTAPNGAGALSAPPPPPPGGSLTPKASGGGHSALLADLNRGAGITSGLRKVDASEQMHKNPELRTSSAVADNTSPKRPTPPPTKPKPASFSKTPPKKPARTELEGGSKWIVENHEDNKDIVIQDTALSQTVHIFGCKNSVVRVVGKVNAVTMVNCKKTSLVVDSLVSSLSFTSSPSFEVQITGVVPTIQVDSTDSGQVYLSKACVETVEIITSKTSALNISIPTSEDGDYAERPVPEQMKSRIVNGRLVTEIVEHAG
ncbi:hypothetical protein CcaverHIS002_0304770 [Cutaneotrichosporon cavernicola]|uniref:Adenylyl cyclase-associated protein n=1 Tax=Cutaneotrichosporon cavernicola TaxID=279322 RepID=A0AA48I6W9_9TREE|nr:uncharacterized protein CcaverHIS019_0304720 [Cutaneotrichosporon cavernicola]BEI82609.1 hypothetical protein CcaverHIS002_0304770 [Cutaneotrichosporon cavernicola]BEI90402.1 hypothetical protein CcaverHIS019_0304720 [Cutaneotrichosporon cavernicola]